MIPSLLMFSAIPAGILALFGIPKFGKKKLLWKGLVGILVPILFTAMMIPTILSLKQAGKQPPPQVEPSR